MKNSNLKAFSFIAVLAVMATGCGLGKMIKKYEEVKYTVTPEILEVHGGKLPIKISGKVPAKYFHKKATATFTPVIKWEGGELALNPITVKGETAEGQGQKIGYVSGGTFNYVDTIPYKKAMKKSEIFAKVALAMGSKTADLPDRLLTNGCIITSTRVENDEDIMYGADKYEKETIISQKGELYYPIQSSVIPSSEMRSSSIKALKAFIANKYETRSVTITAWASPDGPEELNNKISNDRTISAFKYVQRELKRMKLEGADKDELYNKVSKGEYWDGFNQLVRASNIEDKQLILDIVNRHADVNKREEEIKNLAVVYLTLAKEILPKLRKAEITINSLEPKKTDAEIDSLAIANPDSLDVEELFYAATLTKDLDKKLKIYESASKIHANDWRGFNNIACMHLEKGNLDDAKAWLEKAKVVDSMWVDNFETGKQELQRLEIETAEVQNNKGVLATWNGEYGEAKIHYEVSKSDGGNVSNNLGILHVRTGDYETALEYFGSDCSYNSALANLLNNDTEKAKTQGDCAEGSAATSYLKAIIAARMGDGSGMGTNLKAAVGANANYRKDAMNDLEFSKFWDSTDFKSAIQ